MEKWQEREHHREEVIKEAVKVADRIILNGSDGSEEETNFLTAQVASKFVEKSLLPFQQKLLHKDITED